jgi:hypothetical protein
MGFFRRIQHIDRLLFGPDLKQHTTQTDREAEEVKSNTQTQVKRGEGHKTEVRASPKQWRERSEANERTKQQEEERNTTYRKREIFSQVTTKQFGVWS